MVQHNLKSQRRQQFENGGINILKGVILYRDAPIFLQPNRVFSGVSFIPLPIRTVKCYYICFEIFITG
jgi:hypothetical protein